MPCLLHDTAVMRPCVSCLVTLNDSCDLKESNSSHPKHTMIVREELISITGRAETVENALVYKEKQNLV